MFTGIVTHTGTVAEKTRTTLAIRSERDILRALKKGDSISVNGACLTIISKNKESFTADVIPETFKRTNFGTLENGALVNLELPATPYTFLSGHIVQGHVDGLGEIIKIRNERTQTTLSIAIPKRISRYIVPKGSVTVNGVSLTVIAARSGSFSVGIIPHTWKSTMFRALKPKSLVNIEVDVLAKYIEKFSSNKRTR